MPHFRNGLWVPHPQIGKQVVYKVFRGGGCKTMTLWSSVKLNVSNTIVLANFWTKDYKSHRFKLLAACFRQIKWSVKISNVRPTLDQFPEMVRGFVTTLFMIFLYSVLLLLGIGIPFEINYIVHVHVYKNIRMIITLY